MSTEPTRPPEEDPPTDESRVAIEEPHTTPEQPTVAVEREVRSLLESEQPSPETAAEVLQTLRPADQAAVVAELPNELQTPLLEALGSEGTAKIVEEMHPEDAARLTSDLPPSELANVLDRVSPDIAADLLHVMPNDVAAATLVEMTQSPAVQQLMDYPDDVAGGRMTTDYAAVLAEATAAMALDSLRLISEDRGGFSTIFVVDKDRKLVGWVSLRRLALARPQQPVSELMEEAVSVDVLTDQEECARIVARYDLNELPVVDATGKLLGVIYADDLADVAEEEATEDMFRMAGMQGERTVGSLKHSLQTRLPWLTINLGTTFVAAAVVGLFESTISQLAVLAVFLPVVAGQGGIGGTQTLTLVVRGIALGEIGGRQAKRILIREAILGALHGLYLAVLVGAVVLLWERNGLLALVLGVAMFGNMIIAGIVGAGVPLMLRALKQDPAVSSAVVVTTATDVFGFLLFLGLASVVIDRMT